MDSQENFYFHGRISREEAENLLRTHGTNGTFLVRESNTAAGDYVLSVLHDSEVVHYQIQRHQNDAYFSIDDRSTIHGLDQLIDYYRQNQGGLPTPLRQIIKCQPPPVDDLLNGRENLLHRVCQQGNLEVLLPMLKDLSRNLEAKNQDGQTAAHIACIHKREAVLQNLVTMRRININCRDKDGNTPLHYACRHPGTQMVQLLIEHHADVQARNITNGNVPLHDAAHAGNLVAVQLLLEAGAPLMPRTNSGEFPIDFARQGGHIAVVQFLESYVPPTPRTSREEWFHGTLSREEASRKLLAEKQRLDDESGLVDNTISNYDTGIYLVRISKSDKKKFVVSLLQEKKVRNFEIAMCGKFFYIDEGPFMPSLEHLIEHYQNFIDGLPTRLKFPVKPPIVPPAPPVIDFNTLRKQRQMSLPNAANPSGFSFSSIQQQQQATSPVMNAPPVPPLPNKMPEKPVKQPKSSPIKTMISDGFRSFRRNKSSSSSNNNNASTGKSTNDIRLEIASSPLQHLTFTSDFHLDQTYQTPRESGSVINNNNFLTTAEDYIKDDKVIDRSPFKSVKEAVKYENFPSNIISREQLNIGPSIGQGEFGFVYRGIYLHHSGNIEVAIKKLPEDHSEEDHASFIREAQYMMDLHHSCIVRLIGICLEKEVMMIQELVPLGSMLEYLQKNKDNFTDLELECLATEIASGMDYLVSKRFVHRDLAARNVLLKSRVKAKISDFGLSRVFKREENYYEAREGGKWPIKWYAPESFLYGKFSHASDVWSFGIVLWEMFTRGEVPYGDETPGSKVIEMIEKGERLPKPDDCPNEIYQQMLACWQNEPKMRPTFSYLIQFFKQMRVEAGNEVEYTSISDLDREFHASSPELENNNLQQSKKRVPLPVPVAPKTSADFVVNRADVTVGREINKDEFGSVHEGVFHPSNGGNKTPVAVKKLLDATNRQSHHQFLTEFSLLMKINHPFIVKLIGVVVEPPQMILQELCRMGTLLNYVRGNRQNIKPETDIKLWAYQIAAGMNYLGTKNVIHRNLAARNVLLANSQQIKICDFGLAKILYKDQDMYVARNAVKFPSKWYAPESIKHQEFSAKSDVFSYGVLLWELYSFGAEPWGMNVNGPQAMQKLEQGQNLSIPAACPEEVYDQLLLCWNLDPSNRPTFNALMNFFDKLGKMDEDDEFMTLSDVQRLSQTTSTQDSNANSINSNVPNEFLPVDKIINRTDVSLKEQLGEGEFGFVYLGELKCRGNSMNGTFKVAVKTLKAEKAETYRNSFLQEFSVMMKLDHLHIVRLLGIVKHPELMIIQELMTEGPLLKYLRENKDSILPDIELKLWAFQIASGMNYLVTKHFVHRDLSARNILLLTKDICKISDFGLSRAFLEQKEYYAARQAGLWPIKWYAPESFQNGVFSHASDVWSYGVLLYELYSYGEQPYGNKSNKEVIEFVDKGGRLEKPFICSPAIYKKMLQCWNIEERKRPKFSELMEFFAQEETLYENIPNIVSRSMAINNQRESSSNSPIKSFKETFVIRL
ncbi:tyrosine-protein kinase Shark isoform X2 [Culicoides brevitarsis]